MHSEIVYSLSPTDNVRLSNSQSFKSAVSDSAINSYCWLQIAGAFRKFGIADSTKDLLVIKVSVTPDITHLSVANHLGENIKGTPVVFDDATLSSISDVEKIRKTYKLGALSTPPKGKEADHIRGDQKWQFEASLLGAIALRGS